jgi:hypothetical protein
MRVVLALAGFIATAASAGLVTTAKPGAYSLRDSQSKPFDAAAEFNALPAAERTQEACVAAAGKLGVGEYRCTNATTVSVVGSSEDVPKPVVHVVLDANGFLVQPEVKVEALPDGSWGPTMEQGYVKGEYPTCWVPGLVPYTGEWAAPEGPLAQEPGPWIEGVDYPLGEACPEAAGGKCYASPTPPPVPAS